MDISTSVKGIVILGFDGRRILAKYYDDKLNQKTFEKNIFAKTHRTKDEILVIENSTVLHKTVTDLHIYVVGSINENPVILSSVLTCLVEFVSSLLNKDVEKKSVIDHMAEMILALDEICDGGVIIETDPDLVLQRVALKESSTEASMAQVLQSAKEFGFSFAFR